MNARRYRTGFIVLGAFLLAALLASPASAQDDPSHVVAAPQPVFTKTHARTLDTLLALPFDALDPSKVARVAQPTKSDAACAGDAIDARGRDCHVNGLSAVARRRSPDASATRSTPQIEGEALKTARTPRSR